MSYTCDKILNMSRSIDEFQKKVALSKDLNIIESIDKFYNNYYDMLFYMEEQFCYYTDKIYNTIKPNNIKNIRFHKGYGTLSMLHREKKQTTKSVRH